MTQPLYHKRNSFWYPLDRRLGELQAALDAVAKRKKSLPYPSQESKPQSSSP
jgi:hypothetical protein